MDDKFQNAVDALLKTFTTTEQFDCFKEVLLAVNEMISTK